MNTVCAQGAQCEEFELKYVLNGHSNSQYSIVFDGCNFEKNNGNFIIPVKSRREIELLLLILGEEANVTMDEQARQLHPDVWEWLNGQTYSDVFASLRFSYREEAEILELIGRIPLPKTITESSSLQCHPDDPEPEKIDKEYVHKTYKDNVLISKPNQFGNMYYFNGFKKSPEFNIDHDSDHLQGIILFEVARQAVAATTHLAGIPINGTIIILKSTIQYSKFIENDRPVLIQTIPVLKQRGGYYYTVFNIIQDGNSCATGYFSCFRYKSTESYKKQRVSQCVDEISTEKVVNVVNIEDFR